MILDEFAKRQSSIDEEDVHGVASPSNKPKNIIDMVDNIDDDFGEETPEHIKKQNFNLQHMQSDRVYLKADEDAKNIIDHPEQINIPGKPKEDYQNEDELVYEQLKNEKELKHNDDQNNIDYDNVLNQNKRKPFTDSPHNMRYGDIHESSDKNRSTHRYRNELYTVDSILKRRNDSEEYDEGNKLTTKLHQEQTDKIKGESSSDPIGDLEAPKYKSIHSEVNVDDNDSMKLDSQIKQSKGKIFGK